MLLLDMPVLDMADLSSSDSDEISYCHILCRCHATLAMCGAYKPVLCGGLLIENWGLTDCDVCGKAFCPDCLSYTDKACPRCGS